jgi:hypothetical protein
MADFNQGEFGKGFTGNSDPKTREIEELLRQCAKRPLTPQEIQAQRLSFVMGMLPHDTTMTRQQVQEILEREYGRVIE